MITEALDIDELLATLFPEGGGIDLFPAAAPETQGLPYAVYTIIGNDEEEDLEGNVNGGGHLVQFTVYAASPNEARTQGVALRTALEGRHFAPSGVSVRADFDQHRDGGEFTLADSDERAFAWQADFTLTVGD